MGEHGNPTGLYYALYRAQQVHVLCSMAWARERRDKLSLSLIMGGK